MGKRSIPSFIAVESKLDATTTQSITEIGFIPILPHRSTTMDSIYSTMKNFQDVLYQRNESSGALWCDEGVYCIAKEIQLLRPTEFDNIWLGMGPFHWSKILMASMGKFLEHSGIAELYTSQEPFFKVLQKLVS